MLRIEIDDAAMNVLHKSLLESGGNGVKQAMAFMTIRAVLDNLVDSFNRQQLRAANSEPGLVVADGRPATLSAALAPLTGNHGWPKRSGRLLHGLKFKSAQPSSRPQRPNDYFCKLTFGPPQARKFGAYCALFAYEDRNRTGRIVWLGREVDFASALAAV
jgi:hypothetical protein